MCWVVCLFVSFNSPLTKTVTWSLPVPMRFLTSQTKVVLTVSSTFSTLSTLSVICTVSGISPDILQGHEHMGMRKKKREKTKKGGGDENRIVVCLTLGKMRALRQMYIYRNMLYCAMSSNSTNLDRQCKTNQFSPSSKGNPLSHGGGKYDGDRRKIKTAGSGPKISSLPYFVSDFPFFSSNFVTVKLIAIDNTEKGERKNYIVVLIMQGLNLESQSPLWEIIRLSP